ncbi:unnamed protein product [Hyaloperonospora brassicae]|uniref:RxLR effector candidate protein n=1 Tax=Hyaloperonospora brassicae TaxID=162125 RepID=A0AAV0UKP2_HYABA|nr:unnamed protein product [Hyaloperonospora brassicae]
MTRLSNGDMATDSKRDSPKFSELLHAASHSPDSKDVRDMWSSGYPSTSETDNDDDEEEEEDHDIEDHDIEDQDDSAMEAFHSGTTAGSACRSPGSLTSGRSRGPRPTHEKGFDDAMLRLVVPVVLSVTASARNMAVGGSAMKKVATSTWLPVACVGRMEVGGAVKFPTAEAVPKVEVCATSMAVEGVVNEKDAGPVPRKAVFVSHTAEAIAVKSSGVQAVP